MADSENTPQQQAAPRAPRPTSGPAPLYGEYAPVEDRSGTASGTPSGAVGAQVDSSGTQTGAGGGSENTGDPSAGATPIRDVPHNLGVGDSPAAPAPAPGGSYLAPPPQSQPPQAQYPQTQYPQSPTPLAAPGSRGADRVITIILLVIGAFGALYLAASMQQLPSSLSMFGEALGIDGFTVPESVHTLGTIGAISVLALYALNLIYSIRRLRARKITFWVPLAAGAIAFVVVFMLASFALNQTPELMRMATDPDALSKVLEYLQQQAR